MMRTAAEADAETDEPAAKAARASMAKDSPAAAATAPITTLRISHPTPGTAPTAAASGAGNFSLPVKLALHSQRMSREASVELVPGSHGNLAALDGRRLHPSTEVIMHGLREAAAAADVPHPASPPSELASIGLVVDLFLADALAPAVVLITNTPSANALGSALLEALGAALPDELGFIRAIDVTEVKMNRSLYDERDSRSLRDEILDLRRTQPRVAAELLTPTRESELLIREMVEDSPSVVAHSVHKRILHKRGLLFLVRVGAADLGAVSPELLSRASLVL